MANTVVTAGKEQVEWAIAQFDKLIDDMEASADPENGGGFELEVDTEELWKASAILTAVSLSVFQDQPGGFLHYWKQMQNLVKQVNVEHGWYDEELHDAIRIALLHPELSEALEALRHGNPPSEHIPEFSGLEEELADVVIRVMDIAGLRNLRVAEAIQAKVEFNKSRPFRHGGKAF